jgi:hypothetical protein
VVLGAYTLMSDKPANSNAQSSGASSNKADASGERSAPTIFFEGAGNLAKEPLGWLDLAKPTPLRSNMPPPAPPAEPSDDSEGKVVPSAVRQSDEAETLP